MKQITLYAVLILSCLSLCSLQCRKKNGLPDETHEGKGTFGCVIDGTVFTPKGSLYVPAIKCNYVQRYSGVDGFIFDISGYKNGSNCESIIVAVYSDSIKVEEGSTYQLKSKEKGGFWGEYKAPGMCLSSQQPYKTTNEYTGEIHFTRFDLTNKIAAGTFWFDVKDENGVTIQIRNGRFDVPFLR